MTRPVVTCTSSQLATVFEMIALGHGITFVPKMAMTRLKLDNVSFRSLGTAAPTREIVVVTNPDCSISWTQNEAKLLIHQLADEL